jgi:hypothetical protein
VERFGVWREDQVFTSAKSATCARSDEARGVALQQAAARSGLSSRMVVRQETDESTYYERRET